MTKIVLLDRDTFPEDFKFHHPDFPHEWQEYNATSPEEVVERLSGATIAITNKVKLNAEQLAQLPDLKMIAIAATGFDHIDIAQANSQGITVSNVRGYAVSTVPEHAMMMILALSRSLKGYQTEIAEGRWQRENQFCFFSHPIEDLNNKTLGLIGRGGLGEGLARLAKGFGMNIITAARKNETTPKEGHTPFDEFLASCDIISIHCPRNDQTRNLITTAEFAKMTRKPIVINTARGGIINEEDAITAIDSGAIRGLGVDCLSAEPPKDGNPLFKIAHYPNVIITPHVAWASNEAIQSLWNQLINNIEQWQQGSPQNAIEPSA